MSALGLTWWVELPIAGGYRVAGGHSDAEDGLVSCAPDAFARVFSCSYRPGCPFPGEGLSSLFQRVATEAARAQETRRGRYGEKRSRQRHNLCRTMAAILNEMPS